ELRDISADYLLQGGGIDIRNLRARILGGTLVGSYSMHDLSAAQQSQLHAVLRNVSLSSIQAITLPTTQKQFRLGGAANLTLEATWQKASGSLSLDGNMNSISLFTTRRSSDLELRDISADYLLHGGDIDIRNLRARILGGTLVGSYSMRDLAAAQQSRLNAVLRNVSLSSIQAITHPTTRKQFQVGGDANLTLEATWQKASDAFVARGSADLKGSLAPVESTGAFHIVAIEGRIQFAYSAPAAEMTLKDSYLRMPKTTVRLSGTVSRRQSLQIQAHSDDLHEVQD